MTTRRLVCTGLTVLAAGMCWWWMTADNPVNRRAVTSSPASADVVDRARTALQLGDAQQAAQLIETATDLPSHVSPATLFELGNGLAAAGHWQPAERCLQQAVRFAPEQGKYRLRLAMLQYLSGRYATAISHWLYLLRHGGLDLLSLPLLGNRELRWSQEDAVLDRAITAETADPLLCLAVAHRALEVHDFALCERMLQSSLAAPTRIPEAQVHWGRMLYEAGRTEQFSAWLVSMQDTAEDGAELWLLRGHYWREKHELAAALRCYWEAFQRDPNHYVATDLLGRMSQALERGQEAGLLFQRAGLLREYADVCRLIHLADEVPERYLRRAAELAAGLDCSLETIGWCSVAAVMYPASDWPNSTLTRLRRNQIQFAGRYATTRDPRQPYHYSDYPLPVLDRGPVAARDETAVSPDIRFEDVAARVGIDFVFEDGANPATPETLLFEFTGGGVAVLDYDLNGWPDLFFVQGGSPPEFGSPGATDASAVDRPQDQFYANLGTGKFLELSQLCGLTDSTYGQGATVGDFNADGFPDLYVANIGRNCLFANQGDGTFLLQACPAFAEVESWTTSCVMADFSGDMVPDIYDVNHVVREGVHTRMCKSGDASVPCSREHELEAAQDRLLLGDGRGGFTDATATAGIVAPDGLGLGVVAADFHGTGRLDLFVANDGRANFYFVNRGDSPGQSLFDEQALVSGLAYSLRGRAQACMGIAADDANGDGWLDLFVTNFFADYNTLYCQLNGAVFEDVTQLAGIQATSYNYLGFGTQFVDADHDGDADLILTNGDVVDYSGVNPQRSYRQRAQFLENQGEGRFRELAPRQLGEFFASERLGRGMARLDWNRDGREDVAISHIGSPAALLTNTGSTAGHYLDIRLVATRSSRDATGAVVKLIAKGVRVTKQFTAGDGYLASNQKNHIVGLGGATRVEQLEIAWPSGRTATYTDIPADTTLVFVEEASQPYQISSAR